NHYATLESSESFRGLRTNLMFYQQQNDSKTFMITNASQAKGKTTIISNLAISIAYTGKRVLLVDADLRKPFLHKLFRIPNNIGLTSIFYGTNPEEAVQKTIVEGLNILSSGPIPPNPSELLSSTTMDEIINFFADKYDIILFDSTPVVAVTDASILSSKVENTLFMVCVRDDSKQQIKKGMDILKQINANTMGVVYNKVRERELGGYYYRYA
ncbi:CpsD/CapB family tyrosine-protein kinase, partial [bacterium]|nr:CpsD/CapB family tyrosine-protein kinase [bacterium]